jgi:hypothetical protein
MQIPEPLNTIQFWLESYLNPQVEKINVTSKQASSFSSLGYEVTLKPAIKKSFKATENDVTIGFLSGDILAGIAQNDFYKIWILEIQNLDKQLSLEEIAEFENNFPSIGNLDCPTFKYLQYPGQNIFITFKPFHLEFSADICTPDVIAEYLMFRARFLQLKQYISFSPAEIKTNVEYEKKYLDFLISLMWDLQKAEPKKKKNTKNEQEIDKL